MSEEQYMRDVRSGFAQNTMQPLPSSPMESVMVAHDTTSMIEETLASLETKLVGLLPELATADGSRSPVGPPNLRDSAGSLSSRLSRLLERARSLNAQL